MGRKDVRIVEILTGEGPLDTQKRRVVAVDPIAESTHVVNERTADALLWQAWAKDPKFGMSLYGPDVAPNPSTARRLNAEAAKRIIELRSNS